MLSALNHDLNENYVLRNVYSGLSKLTRKKSTLVPALFLLFILILGIVGPALAPHGIDETFYAEEGGVARAEGPSVDHPLGTTYRGNDVLSRVIVGAQPTVITGLLGGTLIITIGMSVGVTAGYVGGRVEEVLMRFTDMVYSIPLIPFAIVLVSLMGIGFIASIVVIGLLLWRGNARVLRSQVLQIKERPYVLSSKATGASTFQIIIRHIIPNIASMAFLFFAIGVGYTIILQAGLAFLGVSSPFVPSWGIMLRNAYNSGYLASQPAWALTPGLLISFTVVSTFMLGRQFEESDEAGDAIATGG